MLRHLLFSPSISSKSIPPILSNVIVQENKRRFFSSSYKAFNLGDHFILEASLHFLSLGGIDVLTRSCWDHPSECFDLFNLSHYDNSFVFLATANAGIASAKLLSPLLNSPVPPKVFPIIFGVGKKEGSLSTCDDSILSVYRYISYTSKLCLWRTSDSASFAKQILGSASINGIDHVVSSCPVPAYFRDLVDKKIINTSPDLDAKFTSFLITLTLRPPYLLDEIAKFKHLVEALRHSFKDARIALSFHQYLPLHLIPSRFAKVVVSLLDFCLINGVDLISPKTTGDAIRSYVSYSVHIGSRLHCHLAFLGMKKYSLLWSLDSRSSEFSHDLGFKLFTFPNHVSTNELADLLASSINYSVSDPSSSRIDEYKSRFSGYVRRISLMNR